MSSLKDDLKNVRTAFVGGKTKQDSKAKSRFEKLDLGVSPTKVKSIEEQKAEAARNSKRRAEERKREADQRARVEAARKDRLRQEKEVDDEPSKYPAPNG